MITLTLGSAESLDIKDNSVDLIITHPPYLGVDAFRYGGNSANQINSSQNKKKMLKQLNSITKEMYRVLKPGGHLIIAIGPNDGMDHAYIDQTIEKTKMKYLDFICQNSYIKNSLENIYYDKIASNNITIWHHFIKPGNAYYNQVMTKRWKDPVWNIPFSNIKDPVDKVLSKDHHVFDAMNSEIPKRFIQMFSKPGQMILDPFGGSGIVAVVAKELGRYSISNDISEDQLKSAKKRILLTFGESHV